MSVAGDDDNVAVYLEGWKPPRFEVKVGNDL